MDDPLHVFFHPFVGGDSSTNEEFGAARFFRGILRMRAPHKNKTVESTSGTQGIGLSAASAEQGFRSIDCSAASTKSDPNRFLDACLLCAKASLARAELVLRSDRCKLPCDNRNGETRIFRQYTDPRGCYFSRVLFSPWLLVKHLTQKRTTVSDSLAARKTDWLLVLLTWL